MFANYSSEQFARIVSAGVLILGLFGVKFSVDKTQIVQAGDALVLALPIIAALAMDLFGYVKRISKGDVTIGGFRK